ncbi:toxin CbtA [Edwardsiella hoshinae]|uniref:Toxin CbtA n=1 Tax=Edwardsiella hoshinae TaxID=93378 RepID=A0ABN4T4H0_9GAMM|nr:TA system toxin CbtA family protein [Edwardsiella hoshinae]AOV98216.1 toxin CbtA [Edwardsiella hoshinae]
MLTSPNSARRAVHACLSPIDIGQTLLTHRLHQHYGLTLNDTPFGNDGVIQAYIDAGIALCDAVNDIVEKDDLVRIDRRGFSMMARPPLLSRIDILRARKACGLMTRNGYRAVTAITHGKYRKVEQ